MPGQWRRYPTLAFVVVMALGLVGCSAGTVEGDGGALDLAPGSGAGTEPATPEPSASVPPPTVDGPVAQIDPSAMPEPGTIVVGLDEELVYSVTDEGQLDFECSLADDRVELISQQQTGQHGLVLEFSDAELVGGEPGTWLGRFTARGGEAPPGSSFGGSGTLAASAIAVEPPWVVVIIDVTFAEGPGDADVDDLGHIEIRATCPS